MALVGAGFNIKMLEAYLALPALLALYAIGAPIAWRKVAGVAGAIAALVAMLGPVSIITYGAAAEWDRLREWRWRPPIEHGIMPVTIGLLLAGTYTLVRLTATDWGGVVITSPPRYCSSADASTQHLSSYSAALPACPALSRRASVASLANEAPAKILVFRPPRPEGWLSCSTPDQVTGPAVYVLEHAPDGIESLNASNYAGGGPAVSVDFGSLKKPIPLASKYYNPS
jgi:hypothetical protein